MKQVQTGLTSDIFLGALLFQVNTREKTKTKVLTVNGNETRLFKIWRYLDRYRMRKQLNLKTSPCQIRDEHLNCN